MNILFKILAISLLFLSFSRPTFADSSPSSALTTFNFQQNNQAVSQPVNFTIKCYGTAAMDKNAKILKISEISEICSKYGCQFDTTNIFETYRNDTKYCDMTGKIGDQEFSLPKFFDSTRKDLICHRPDYSIGKNNKFLKTTPKYNECIKNVYREYYPQGNGEVKGDFLCAQYQRGNYLTATDISSEVNGPCYRYGYTIKNNICYKISDEFFNCTSAEQQKMDSCDQYLEDMTSKLDKNSQGSPYEQLCQVKISLPKDLIVTNTSSVAPINTIESQNIFNRIVTFFKALFLR